MRDGKTERKREGTRKTMIRRHTDLEVYGRAFDAAIRFFELSKKFHAEERYSLTDQARRSLRSVCSNLAEAWRKRRYPASFVSKLSDSEGEAAEVQTWIQFAVSCGYLETETARALYAEYDDILAMLVHMITHSDDWKL